MSLPPIEEGDLKSFFESVGPREGRVEHKRAILDYIKALIRTDGRKSVTQLAHAAAGQASEADAARQRLQQVVAERKWPSDKMRHKIAGYLNRNRPVQAALVLHEFGIERRSGAFEGSVTPRNFSAGGTPLPDWLARSSARRVQCFVGLQLVDESAAAMLDVEQFFPCGLPSYHNGAEDAALFTSPSLAAMSLLGRWSATELERLPLISSPHLASLDDFVAFVESKWSTYLLQGLGGLARYHSGGLAREHQQQSEKARHLCAASHASRERLAMRSRALLQTASIERKRNGYCDYQGRTRRGLHHHHTLCMAANAFKAVRQWNR